MLKSIDVDYKLDWQLSQDLIMNLVRSRVQITSQ